jgi:hypothetical protein
MELIRLSALNFAERLKKANTVIHAYLMPKNVEGRQNCSKKCQCSAVHDFDCFYKIAHCTVIPYFI